MNRRNFLLAFSALPAIVFTNSAIAGCVRYENYTVRCSLCGGDGLEDSGKRIGLPRSEWKNKHTCRACGGSGSVTQRKCTSRERSKPSRAIQK